MPAFCGGRIACERTPLPVISFSVSQSGNTSAFEVSSADPTIAGGGVVMLGPGGQGDPAVALGQDNSTTPVVPSIRPVIHRKKRIVEGPGHVQMRSRTRGRS